MKIPLVIFHMLPVPYKEIETKTLPRGLPGTSEILIGEHRGGVEIHSHVNAYSGV